MALPSKIAGDVKGALQYAHGRLAHGLDARYQYHNVFHTFGDVMPAAVYLAEVHDLSGEERDLLRVGVAFHDIGFFKGPENHELRGIALASQVLPGLRFSPEAVDVVGGLILATRMPQSPANLLEEIIADADLDVLGRDDFMARNAILYRETVGSEKVPTKNDWLRQQVQFLKEHRYFTQAARDRRDAGKERNLSALLEQIA